MGTQAEQKANNPGGGRKWGPKSRRTQKSVLYGARPGEGDLG
jgi:hypothetical protein